MRYVGALLAVLLVSSTAHATVYVWKDRAGSLVLTNLTSELRDAPPGSLVTYATTDSSEATAAGSGAATTAPATPDRSAPTNRSPVAGVVTASAVRASPAPVGQAPRTHGLADAQHAFLAAATTPTDRPVVEPRELLDDATRAAPQVIVRLVAPSETPLSTSHGMGSLAGGSSSATSSSMGLGMGLTNSVSSLGGSSFGSGAMSGMH